MYIPRVVIFSLDELNLTRSECFRDKGNLVKYEGKRISQDVIFIIFSSFNPKMLSLVLF